MFMTIHAVAISLQAILLLPHHWCGMIELFMKIHQFGKISWIMGLLLSILICTFVKDFMISTVGHDSKDSQVSDMAFSGLRLDLHEEYFVWIILCAFLRTSPYNLDVLCREDWQEDAF